MPVNTNATNNENPLQKGRRGYIRGIRVNL